MNRRSFLATSVAASVVPNATLSGKTPKRPMPDSDSARWQDGRSCWPICLDTATLDQSLPIETKVRLAAEAGFDAIEPWDRELELYEKNGGDLADLGELIRDLGLYVPSVIGLWGAMDSSREQFETRLAEHRNRMRMVSLIGSQHVQVIPNFKEKELFSPEVASWCYGRILEMAINDYNMGAGVVFLNFFSGLSTISDATQVAFGAGHERAQIIPDTYHMYLGGSKLENLQHLQGEFISIFQFSDCPAGVEPQKKAADQLRVLHGDGILPLVDTLKTLRGIGYKGAVSLELYNPEFRAREPKSFLEEALAKTVAVAEKASL